MGKKQKVGEIEHALGTEIQMCGDDSTPYGDLGRCYGLAQALAILTDSSTDEELARVADKKGLTRTAERVFGWTVRT